MNSIVWLSSYPKSGNTWFRVFLTNLQHPDSGPAQINNLSTLGIASSRTLFDDAAGIEASDLLPEEIEHLRPKVYEQLAADAEETLFLKIHDGFTRNADGVPLVPASVTAGVLYFIRNPLDVAVSFAHHEGIDVETIIQRMNNPENAFCLIRKRLQNQLYQRLLTWSQHVESWVDHSGLRLLVVRYEDMKLHPMETFTEAARFCGLPDSPDRIQLALDYSDISELQRQEQEHGFVERHPRTKTFFRKGITGSWREALTPAQVDQIIHDHGEVMRRFGYLDDQSNPIY